MKKRTLYSLVITLTLFTVMFIMCGLTGLTGANKVIAETPKPEPITLEGFAMREGASIRYSDPSGIRFTTYVNPDYYNGLVESGKTFHFGTIYAPATAYSGTIEDFDHSSTVTGGVSDIIIGDTNWDTDTVNEVAYKTYNTVQLFSENARNNGYYGVKMYAKSYVWIDEDADGEEDAEEFTYVDGAVRSIAQVAAIALENGNDNVYIDRIPGYALGSGSVTLNDIDYHKSGNNTLEPSRANQDYIYLPSGGTADFNYTPALLHTGAYMTAASDYAVTYGSGNDSVFTVGGGTITAVGAGTASLTAGVGTRVVAPVTTVSVVSPASSVENGDVLTQTFSFDDVSYYGDSHILTFDADYINGKIAEGYNYIQVTMSIPSNGGSGISVRLYIDDTENRIASGDTTHTSVSGTYDLVSDKAYSVLFRQSVSATLDMSLELQFIKGDLVWEEGTNTKVSVYVDGANSVSRVTTTEGYNSTAGYVTIPAERLTGKALVSFDFKILSMKDNGGADITEPKLIWYQAAGEAGTSNYGNYWSVPGGRLTPKDGGVNEGYQRIVKVSDSTEMAWNDTFAWDTWYRVTLTLKYDDVQLSQVMNAGAGQYDILYKDFVFEDEYDLSWNVGSNNTIIAAPYENENITRIMNSGSQGYIYIPSEDLAGIGTVSFDFNIKSISVTKPKIIYLQDVPGANPYGAYWDASVRLTPRGDNPSYTNIGYQTITKISDSTSMNWDDDFETDTWYRVTLKLKSAVQLIQVVNNANACSYDILYKNFVFERDTIWNTAINAEISNYEYNDEIVTRVTTTSRAASNGSAVTIPTNKLSGIATVSFDIMVLGFNGTTEGTVQPKFIYYHYNPSSESDYGSYWNNDIRLTDRGANVGYATIIKVSDSSSVAWDGDFEIGCWYRVTLTLKSTSVPVAQVANNGGACTYDALYKNFVFTPAA